MNFFEHQDRARRQTRFLVMLFALAVIGIMLAVNALVLAVFGYEMADPPHPETLGGFLRQNTELIVITTVITGVIIGMASMVRTLQMRGGGGEVARQLGATLVESDTRDPLRRRLRNVVEEIAIASGVPVPEIYVLEHEQGINAFAAGYSTADAAVAVTRGALEHLDRDELQGVIAHEFSHIHNGDMRLNIRLIGFLFGILVIAILGRRLLFSARFARGGRNAAPAVAIGLAVVIIGYIGLFFGRWIKSAVSRQREYLADASAVQFTRQPEGIAGALKKIGAVQAGSYMNADVEEIGHMLFGRGMSSQMFATHPPLEKRIRAIDPSFDPSEFKEVAARLDRHAQAKKAEAEEAERTSEARQRGPGGLALDADNLAEKIGQPGLNQVFVAAALAAAIPEPLERAAHSDEWAQEVICFLLLADDASVREEQLLIIARHLGAESERQVRELREASPGLPEAQRLPLLEIAFPALRRRPEAELVSFMRLIEELVAADGEIDVFEYALARLTNRHILDALHPERSRSAGSKKLPALKDQAVDLIAIVAHHGHPGRPEAAEAAFADAVAPLEIETGPSMPRAEQWPERLDNALKRLDRLRPAHKQKLVNALARCVTHDGEVIAAEMELVRVVCAMLHVPIPVLEDDRQ